MAERKAPAKKAAAAPESTGQETADHTVEVTDVPASYAEQGGDMVARCSCGWELSEHYHRDRFARTARISMNSAGMVHAADPDGAETI